MPPDGWSLPSTAPEVLAAFRVLADPTATLDARVGAVQDGDALREQVAAGLADDALRAGGVAFNVEGARLVDADHAADLCTRSSRVVSRASRRRIRSSPARYASTACGAPPVATRAG